MVNTNLAYVRKDLIDAHLAVPVGDFYYLEKTPLMYRWKNDNCFEVCILRDWHKAYSIDWEFIKYEPEKICCTF